jgi:hypothetical protein
MYVLGIYPLVSHGIHPWGLRVIGNHAQLDNFMNGGVFGVAYALSMSLLIHNALAMLV